MATGYQTVSGDERTCFHAIDIGRKAAALEASAPRPTEKALWATSARLPAELAASPVSQAFAIPAMSGSRGRILVTAAMLGALDPAERRVLLAHECAHLTHRHALVCTAMTLAAAANPALGRGRTIVALLVERWADEQAATAVEDRTITTRAALIAHRARPACALTFTDRTVTHRVAALQTAPPPRLWPLAAAVLVLGLLPAFGAADATHDLLELLEHAWCDRAPPVRRVTQRSTTATPASVMSAKLSAPNTSSAMTADFEMVRQEMTSSQNETSEASAPGAPAPKATTMA
ncbi:hypothetical protein BFF78_37630 [Streptomyces fodineus]|uniref:Peptidase M48 domain-containing protein n=1 Tax=Streptomyces fodineus TaxID=1904616 RepID=A0A1D7YKE3_9ACTN|nr:M48 family metalloprotease [Streptomyces fodineus]AOR36016.1 hypothetical protein BFF78_37630 [Streptomyces fodineus]